MSNSDESVASTAPDAVKLAVKTPLWMSLYVASVTSPAVNENTISSVPNTNNPRPLRVMGDNAEYWVNDAGEAFTFKFPATVDLDGQFDRTGPYFNLPQDRVGPRGLKKDACTVRDPPTRQPVALVFSRRGCQVQLFSPRYVKCSPRRGRRRPKCLAGPEYASQRQSYPLVGNMTDRSPVPRLRRCDIGKGDSMRSPCKAKAAAMGGGSPGGGQSSVQGVPAQALLSDLPDPLGRYSSLITQFNLHEATVVAPNIRDVVVVECQLKLWTITPNRRDTAPSDDKNGSRRYQVMLKSMKLLPDTSITPATFANYWTDVKGKRKATDDVDGSACAKKGFSNYGSDDDEDDAATLKDIHAMQVNDD
ncbi:hypothetical protein EV702DRAFT_1198798 [Suillus placidus]|uniref:Uncharacterized protein n=1 Tax=Suillus placidus TaxID=48579 RepID=A0A9P7D1S7_9AGAM|nr:hypothetical protein EV702DRAFT_1198798 [Suillus placidus]